jgi:hypothetical protein
VRIGQHIKPGIPGVVPWVTKVNAKYMCVCLSDGINLDLFLGTKENFGGLFLMRTSSGKGPSGNVFDRFTPTCFQDGRNFLVVVE